MSKSVRDVAELLGCSQEYVKAAYHSRDLPGYVLSMDGEHFRYLMTDEAFAMLSRGEWQPKPKRVVVIDRKRCQHCLEFLPMTVNADGEYAWYCQHCKNTGYEQETAA
jgi:hypothetical protein